MLVYFAFTSLTTVGLGDFTPKGDIERIAITVTLLSGVLIVSFIIGEFISILNYQRRLDDSDDEG